MIKGRQSKRYLVDLRDTLIIFFHEEMGFIQQDVAEIMGINKGTVSRILRRRKRTPFVELMLETIKQKKLRK